MPSSVMRFQTSFLVQLASGLRSDLARLDRARARPATDTWITLVVERVVRNAFVGDALPNVFLGPIGQRAEIGPRPPRQSACTASNRYLDNPCRGAGCTECLRR